MSVNLLFEPDFRSTGQDIWHDCGVIMAYGIGNFNFLIAQYYVITDLESNKIDWQFCSVSSRSLPPCWNAGQPGVHGEF